jgi:hypothetical protein
MVRAGLGHEQRGMGAMLVCERWADDLLHGRKLVALHMHAFF